MNFPIQVALLAFVLFGAIPALMALTIEVWFWRLPLIRKLWPKKVEWDTQPIWLPGTSVSVKEYREAKTMGAKITVAHHLASIANDVKTQLVRAQLRAFLWTFIGLALVFFVEQGGRAQSDEAKQVAVAPNTTAQNSGPSVHPRQQAVVELGLRLLATYTTPIAAAILIVEAVTLVLGLYDQSRRYEELLDPARVMRRVQRGL